MTWTKFDDNFSDRPDVLSVNRSARWLLAEAYIWCNKHETDGRLPANVLPRISDSEDLQRDVRELMDAGLFVLSGKDYQLDWSEQEQAADVRQRREARAERQRAYRRRGQLHDAGDHSECTAQCRQKQENVTLPSRNAPRSRYTAGPAETSDSDGNVTRNVNSSVPPTRPDPSRPVPTRPLGRGGKGEGRKADAALTASAGATADAGAAGESRLTAQAFALTSHVSHVSGNGIIGFEVRDGGEADNVHAAQIFVEAAQALETSLGGWPAGWKLDADEVADGYAALTIPAAEAAQLERMAAGLSAEVRRRLSRGAVSA